MLRLDYLSCVLTIVSTVMIGRRKWQGWIVAAINSLIICVIAERTAQTGFIPANLFCLALYAYNILQWRHGSPFPVVAHAHASQAARRPFSPVANARSSSELGFRSSQLSAHPRRSLSIRDGRSSLEIQNPKFEIDAPRSATLNRPHDRTVRPHHRVRPRSLPAR
jgi:hypothetical protein